MAASFRNDGQLLLAFDVVIPARSSIARSLFVRLAGAADPATTLVVSATEVTDDPSCLGTLPPTCPLVAGGLAGSVTLNPPGAVPALRQPDGSDVDVTQLEVYPPGAGAANVTSANVTSQRDQRQRDRANVTSANVTSANVTSTHIANPDLANVTSANVTSANVTSANVTSANVTSAAIAANVTSANVTSANVTSAAISDANYTVTNDGNTTHSYHVRIVGSVPAGTPLQLILSKPYTVPLALGCTLYEEPRAQVVANVDDVAAAVVPPGGADLADPEHPRSARHQRHLRAGARRVPPGHGPRRPGHVGQMTELTTRLAPGRGGRTPAAATPAPLLVTSDGTTLADAARGHPLRGAPSRPSAARRPTPGRWRPARGRCLPGSRSPPAGQLAGIPSAAGTATFTVPGDRLRRRRPGPRRAPSPSRWCPARPAPRLSVSPSPSSAYQPVVLTATVSPAAAGTAAPTGSVTFLDGDAVARDGRAPGRHRQPHRRHARRRRPRARCQLRRRPQLPVQPLRRRPCTR